MYIIIRGGCHIRILRKDQEEKKVDVVVGTLYDGKAFGELSLM